MNARELALARARMVSTEVAPPSFVTCTDCGTLVPAGFVSVYQGGVIDSSLGIINAEYFGSGVRAPVCKRCTGESFFIPSDDDTPEQIDALNRMVVFWPRHESERVAWAAHGESRQSSWVQNECFASLRSDQSRAQVLSVCLDVCKDVSYFPAWGPNGLRGAAWTLPSRLAMLIYLREAQEYHYLFPDCYAIRDFLMKDNSITVDAVLAEIDRRIQRLRSGK